MMFAVPIKSVASKYVLNRIACLCLMASASALSFGQGQLRNYSISTIAGTAGTAGFTGDGSAATSAQLNAPLGLALSGSTLYISDQLNHAVRSVALGTGAISTFAGTNTAGNSGDGAAATKAQMSNPTGIGVGQSGNIYIADSGNSTVRLVVSAGNISTVAGNKSAGYSGDPNLATGAQLNLPYSVAVNTDGSYFIADANNNRIRKVGTDGNINTVVGTGAIDYTGDGGLGTVALINHPEGLALDTAGNLYFADTGNHVIRKLDTKGIITTVAGKGTNGFSGDNGKATAAQLNHPEAIALDAAGNLYIADTFNHRIREVLASDGTIHTIAGTGFTGFSGDGGSALGATLRFPRGIAVDPIGIVYVSDNQNQVIRALTPVNIPVGSIPNISTIVSAFEFTQLSTTAAGSWIEIYGTNLAKTGRLWKYEDFNALNIPFAMDDVTVTVAGQPAYLSYISPGQIDALLPSSVPAGVQPVVVTNGNGISAAFNITVKTTQPLLAAPPGWNAAGKQYAASFFLDGTYVLPPVAGQPRRRAKAGDVVVFYGIGFGRLTSGGVADPAGQSFTQLSNLSAPVAFLFNNIPGKVLYAGLSPYTLGQTMYNIGLYQFDVVIPAGVTGDFVPVTFTVDLVNPGTQTLYTAIGN